MPPDANMPLRIVFTGAECTGKTTLAAKIASELNEPCSEEYVRQYAATLKRPIEKRDLDPIARGQLRAEDEAFRLADRFVIHDTNLLSSILYAEHYFDTRLPWVDEAFSKRDYAFYFLCLPDVPWAADPGQRVSPDERATLHDRFVATFSKYGINPLPLGGSFDIRIQKVLTVLKALRR